MDTEDGGIGGQLWLSLLQDANFKELDTFFGVATAIFGDATGLRNSLHPGIL